MVWRSEHPLTGHFCGVLFVHMKKNGEEKRRQFGYQLRSNNNYENVTQHATQQKIVFDDKVVVSTIKLMKRLLQSKRLIVRLYQLVCQ